MVAKDIILNLQVSRNLERVKNRKPGDESPDLVFTLFGRDVAVSGLSSKGRCRRLGNATLDLPLDTRHRKLPEPIFRVLVVLAMEKIRSAREPVGGSDGWVRAERLRSLSPNWRETEGTEAGDLDVTINHAIMAVQPAGPHPGTFSGLITRRGPRDAYEFSIGSVVTKMISKRDTLTLPGGGKATPPGDDDEGDTSSDDGRGVGKDGTTRERAQEPGGAVPAQISIPNACRPLIYADGKWMGILIQEAARAGLSPAAVAQKMQESSLEEITRCDIEIVQQELTADTLDIGGSELDVQELLALWGADAWVNSEEVVIGQMLAALATLDSSTVPAQAEEIALLAAKGRSVLVTGAYGSGKTDSCLAAFRKAEELLPGGATENRVISVYLGEDLASRVFASANKARTLFEELLTSILVECESCPRFPTMLLDDLRARPEWTGTDGALTCRRILQNFVLPKLLPGVGPHRGREDSIDSDFRGTYLLAVIIQDPMPWLNLEGQRRGLRESSGADSRTDAEWRKAIEELYGAIRSLVVLASRNTLWENFRVAIISHEIVLQKSDTLQASAQRGTLFHYECHDPTRESLKTVLIRSGLDSRASERQLKHLIERIGISNYLIRILATCSVRDYLDYCSMTSEANCSMNSEENTKVFHTKVWPMLARQLDHNPLLYTNFAGLHNPMEDPRFADVLKQFRQPSIDFVESLVQFGLSDDQGRLYPLVDAYLKWKEKEVVASKSESRRADNTAHAGQA